MIRLTSKARKQQEKQEERMKHKLMTIQEVSELLYKFENEIKEKYDMLYALALVNCLNAKPFGFGRKRLSELLDMFFGQVEGLILKTIDPEEMMAIANNLGVRIEVIDGKLEIDINDEKQNTLYANKNALKINNDRKVI